MKLIGGSYPEWVFVFLTLFTLAKNVSKTNVLKKLLSDWIEEQRKVITEDILINEIAKRYTIAFRAARSQDKRLTLDEFLLYTHDELVRKELPEVYINLILKRINKG